jgi:8-oxo-dGTP diphosphatase
MNSQVKTALLVIDVQNDFCPGGALPVERGDEVADAISSDLLWANPETYSLKIASQDWHVDPGEHFAEAPDFERTWPVHCVAGSPGAALHPSINRVQEIKGVFDHVVRKGEYAAAYSAFDGKSETGESLIDVLKKAEIDRVDIVGLAVDYCVKATALDAIKAGFGVRVLLPYTAGVAWETTKAALHEMRGSKVQLEGVTANGWSLERAGGERYNPYDYAPTAHTVDIACFTVSDGTLQVLLVRRGEDPYRGQWALPGGFVRPDENLEEAALREVREEVGIKFTPGHLEQLQTYGAPLRDPRMRVVSTAYIAFTSASRPFSAGGDASEARFFPVTIHGDGAEVRDVELAFDHARILQDAVERLQSKLEYTSLATTFVASPFAISDLLRVYEAVWGQKLHHANFQRKVLSSPGFVIEVQTTASNRRGRPPRLYRRGDAAILYPPILRPDRIQELAEDGGLVIE